MAPKIHYHPDTTLQGATLLLTSPGIWKLASMESTYCTLQGLLYGEGAGGFDIYMALREDIKLFFKKLLKGKTK